MAITTGDMAAGDVLVVNTEIITRIWMELFRFEGSKTGDTAFVAGQTYEIATMGSSRWGKTVDIAAFDEDAGCHCSSCELISQMGRFLQ